MSKGDEFLENAVVWDIGISLVAMQVSNYSDFTDKTQIEMSKEGG